MLYGADVPGPPSVPDVAGPESPRLPAPLQPTLDPDVDPEYPDLDGVDLTGARLTFPEARTMTVLRSRLVACELDDTEAALDATDATFDDMDLTGRRIQDLRRVRFTRCRLGGVDLGESHFRDVHFDGCVLDLASLRAATVERVTISGGRMVGIDLSGSQLTDVVLAGVGLADVTLDGARFERVDLTGADLSRVTDLASLRGAIIGEAQAVGLAPLLARAAGIHVAPAGESA